VDRTEVVAGGELDPGRVAPAGGQPGGFGHGTILPLGTGETLGRPRLGA
jgi:hypothetical protein